MGEEPEAQALGPISYLVLEFRVSPASQSLGGSGPAGVLPTGTAVRPAAVRSPPAAPAPDPITQLKQRASSTQRAS